jgi:lipoprotein-releasing system ATP-binding protein
LWTRDLRKSYHKGIQPIPVLRGVNMTVDEGEFLSIIGQSGSGKSTLLHLLGTLDAPDSGEIHFSGSRVDTLPTKQKDRLRNAAFGMIFQFYHLLPELSTLENVLLPTMISCGVWRYWKQRRAAQDHAQQALELVGMGHRLRHRPRELSGGEMQRVAIARALVSRPRLLLSDEPTGNLDQQTTAEIIDLLQSLNHDHKLTIVMVTHDLSLAEKTDRTIRLHEGRVQATSMPEHHVA